VVVGLLVIVFGLAFLGLVPGMQRELRIHRLPAAGLVGAPVLGAVFAFSWAPCIGPTLGAVQGLAATAGRTDRAAVLAVAYCLGLGIPFVVFGLLFRRLLGVFRVVRRNSRWVTRIGGALLIAMGLTMVAGGWNDLTIWLLTTFDVSLDIGTLL
jgi:cytochrome c-type biogenesis protein